MLDELVGRLIDEVPNLAVSIISLLYLSRKVDQLLLVVITLLEREVEAERQRSAIDAKVEMLREGRDRER